MRTLSMRWVWRIWLRVVLLAVVGNLLLRTVALALFEIPPAFAPLAMVGPTLFFTVIGVSGAVLVWRLVERASRDAVPLFRKIAVAALLLSLVPDVWLLTDGAVDAFPGVTVPGVITLMLQHVLAACVVVWMLTVKAQPA